MQGLPHHLVIFAREPRLGRVKRRLARDIGDHAAFAFYRDQLRGLLRALGRDPRWTTWLAVTPDAAAARPIWPPRIPVFGQGEGDLGQRMARVFASLPPGPALIVGSDIPRIGRGDVARAFRSLGRAEATLGPSGDGGYWLVGLRRLRPQPPDLFAGVRWSGPYAYDDTLATLPAGWRIGQEPVLEDVDTGGDYHRLMGTLAAREVRS